MFDYRDRHGKNWRVVLSRRARRNLILRVIAADTLAVSAPPRASRAEIATFLAHHQEAIDHLSAALATQSAWPPPVLWWRGDSMMVHTDADAEAISFSARAFRLPEGTATAQKARLRRFYQQAAAAELPGQFAACAEVMRLKPPPLSLTSAKRLWGVCRPHGIRLNWRLIGAPPWVAEYVCIHELAHLIYPNHSAAFWQLVRRHSADTDAARAWLRTHGAALFCLD